MSAGTSPKKTHRQMVDEWKKDPEFKAEYDSMETEYLLLKDILRARHRAGMTQADVAAKMGTHAAAITRLEKALVNAGHSPKLETLKKYAEAVGCRLEIRIKPV